MALFKTKNKEEEINNTEPVLEGQSAETDLVKTSLVFASDWDVSNQEKYVYMYKHQQLPLLKKNQISIQGLKLLNFQDGFVVVAFLRNTLDEPIQFENVDILILDESGETLAKKRFELDSIGEIPAMSCIPWRFLFSNEDKFVETIPEEGWSIAFKLKQERVHSSHQLDLDESWAQELVPVQIEQLEQLVSNLPALRPDEINIMGLEARQLSNGNISVTVLVRNGGRQNIQIKQLPLILEDALEEVICQANFTLENFTVKANTTKPWTFIFPKELITKEHPDLTQWKVSTPS